ncbi:MAG: cation:proton antiporter [Myxococcota bacterium]
MTAETAVLMLTLGLLLLAGLATDALGRLTRLPRVSLLLLLGLLLGPAALDLLPVRDGRLFSMATQTALAMVGFLLGERFTPADLREKGRSAIVVSLTAVAVTAVCVTALLWALGVPPGLALLLGAISTSTAPAATIDVVEQEEAEGPFARLLLGVVAIDDAWGLLLFGFVAASVAVAVDGGSAGGSLALATREVAGAVALGGVLGVPVAALTARIRPGEPTLLEALGAVLVCGGLALWLEVSPLLAAMTLGACVANLARHHERPFHAIRDIERPFLVVFFVLAGASLDLAALPAIGGIGLAYVVFRAAGRLAGGWLGASLAGEPAAVRRWMGAALMPQAGVALGLAIIAAERFPEMADPLLSIVVGSTVLFEILGPMGTRAALRALR